jgi:hypothetical protein
MMGRNLGRLRMHKQLRFFCTAGAFAVGLTLVIPVAATEGAQGKVVVTSGGELGVELGGGEYGMGSKVEIIYATPDGDEISYGFCCIDNIRDSLRAASGDERLWAISARPVEVQGQASVGLTARVILLEGQELVAWFEKAAAADCRGAQLRLAKHYQYGWDVAQDWGRAMELARKAAQEDHFDARRELAGMLQSREMSGSFDQAQRDAMRREVFQIYLALAEDGFTPAYKVVGDKYKIGYGTDRNPAEAERWHRLAAENPGF